MKSIKLLLAALVFTATFAACSKEDMTPTQEIQNDEFVGAQLAGTNVTLNFGVSADTKVTSDGNWEVNDKMGLAWVVKGDHTTTQAEKAAADNPKPFANHLFYNVDGNQFTTKGNVYVGWHFAYFPYRRMDALNKPIEIAINPAQTYADFDLDYWNTALNVSALQFVTASNVVEENDYQLSNSEDKELHFKPLKAPKTIKVNVKPSATFTGAPALKDLSINSIYLEAKEKVFYGGNVVLDPTALAKPVFTDGVYDEAETFEALYNSFGSVMMGKYDGTTFTAPVYTSNITTLVANDEINLSGEQTLRIHTLPKKLASMDKTKVKFIINVDNGFFTVQYISDEEDPRYNENNNEAIEDLVEAYTGKGNLTAYNNKNKAISLELTEDMFTVDFSKITSEKVWNQAVAMVDALGLEEADFTIVKGEDGKDWEFKDFDGDGNLVNLPADAVVTVKDGGSMILNANGEWPADGVVVETTVNVKKTLDVADGVKFEAKKIINNGVINAGVKSSINPVDNKSRINVVYGSYVTYATPATKGVVAYTLLANETPARINTLLNGGDNGKYAQVNTLVINDGIVLDMMMTSTSVEGNDPYYNEVVSTNALADLSNINIEMNGGSIIGDVTLVDFVNNVSVLSNSNSIKDLNIKGNLTVKENASVVLDATARSYGKKALTFNGNIINNGTLTAEVDVNISSIDNSKGITVVTNPYTITYSGAYKQGGLANGRILEKDTPTPGKTVEVTNLTEFNAKLADNTVKVIVLKGLSTDANWKWTGVYDLKGKTIKVEEGVRFTFAGAIKDFTLKNGVIDAVIYANATKVTTFDGITFKTDVLHTSSEANLEVAPTANVVVKNSTFENKVGRAIVTPYNTFAGNLTVDNTLFKSSVGQMNPYINPVLTGKVKLTNNIFELALVCEFTGKEAQFTIEGNTFESMLCVSPATAVPGIKSTDGLPAASANFCKKVIEKNNFARADKVAVFYTDRTVYYSEF